MKKIIVIAALLVAGRAFAADVDASFREGTRTQVQSNIYSVAVSLPGNATVTSNLVVGGTATITGVATLTAAPVLTAGISGGVSVTNTFYTVPAGTANCITNVIKTRAGITASGTTTL